MASVSLPGGADRSAPTPPAFGPARARPAPHGSGAAKLKRRFLYFPGPFRRAAILAIAVLVLALGAQSAAARFAAADPASLCDRAIAQAAARHGAPERLLRALAKVESGRKGRPWPWTVNAGGEGRWFEDQASALAWAEAKLAGGVRSIDLGCLQINRIWHGEAFRSLGEMLDPFKNADYAARYLMSLEAETGDWMRAAGYYHSRTKEHFDRYSAKVAVAYDALGGGRAPSPARRPPLEAPPAPANARPQEMPDEVRVALWSGLLRRPQKALFLDLYGGSEGEPSPAASRRGGVALAFGKGSGSLLTRGKPLVADKRESVLKN